MSAADISVVAHRLLEAQGPKALAEVAQKARSFENAGDEAQAKFWRQVEAVLFEIRGPGQS